MKLLKSIALLVLMTIGAQRMHAGVIPGLSDVLQSAAHVIRKIPGNFFINSAAILGGCCLLPQSTREGIIENMPFESMKDFFNHDYTQKAVTIVRTVSIPVAILLFMYMGNTLNSTKV